MSAVAGHQAALATPLRSPAARWPVVQLQNFSKIVRTMLVSRVSLEIELMRD